jgi:hypothetical protein
MSTSPQMRRADKALPEAQVLEILAQGFCGRLAVHGPDGYPYCVPLLYVWQDNQVWLHNARAPGHLRASVANDARVCFEMDEPDVRPRCRHSGASQSSQVHIPEYWI